MKDRLRTVLAVSLGLGLSGFVLAGCGGGSDESDDYPDKSIEVIVPFPPGGGADTAIRTLQPSLEESLGESLVILNKQGGGGTVGATQASKAEPDGYTWLLMTVGPAATQPHLQDLSYGPDSFDPVTLVNNEALVLTVPADSSIQSVDDLTDAARSGDLTWAAPPVGGVPHLGGELVLQAMEGSARMVPFDGTGPAVTALLGDQIDVASLPAGVVAPHIDGGKLRAIAVTSSERLSGLSDVPTLTESGIDVEVTNWNGIALPAGTPDDILDTVGDALRTAIDSDAYQKLLEKSRGELAEVTPTEFADLWARDFDRFGELIAALKKEGAL